MQEQEIPTINEDVEQTIPVEYDNEPIQGINATIQIGTTTTGEAGTNASVENVGTETHAILDFTIPRGDKGEQGEQGETGPRGSVKSQYVAELPAGGDTDTFYLVDRDLESHTESGEYITLETTQTAAAIQSAQLNGNATQTGTPTPDAPVPISVVTGENVVKVVGKNIFTPTSPTRTTTRYGVTITIDDDGKVTLNGTATANLYPDLVYGIQQNTVPHSTCYQYFGANLQITASLMIAGGTATGLSNAVRFVFNDEGTAINVRFDGASTSTTINNAYGLNRVWFNIPNGATFDNYSFYCQLELGSTATPYQAYTERSFTLDLGSIELAKIGTYQDRIYKDGEKWYVEKQVGKATYNGSETWNYVSSDNGYFQFNTPSMNVVPFDGNPATNALCDHFIPRSRWYVATGKVNRTINLNGSYCAIRYETYPPTAQGLADFKTWLASNPTTVYYALATPTVTEITNQTLIDQLEALASASLGYGANNIWTEIATGNAMPTLELNWVEWEKYNRHNVYIWNDDIDDWQVIVGMDGES